MTGMALVIMTLKLSFQMMGPYHNLDFHFFGTGIILLLSLSGMKNKTKIMIKNRSTKGRRHA